VAVKSSRKSKNILWQTLALCNDANTSSLTSGILAEHQEVSLKKTIDEVADATTGGNDIGLWPANIPEKMQEYS